MPNVHPGRMVDSMARRDTSLFDNGPDRALASLLGLKSGRSCSYDDRRFCSHANSHASGHSHRSHSYVGHVATSQTSATAASDKSERDIEKETKVLGLLNRTRFKNGRVSCDSTGVQNEDTMAARVAYVQKKFAKMLGHEDVQDGAWIHNIQANALFSSLILLNLVVIGFETDYLPDGEPVTAGGWWLWFLVQSFFAAAFLVEVLLRWHAERAEYWRSCWNLFDVFNCLVTVIETWVLMPVGTGAIRQYMGVLRLMRLMRLVRVLRLLRFFHELWVVMQAMVSAVCSCSWVLILTLLIIYIFAIFTTMMLGHAGPANDEVTQQRWGKVGSSMFTLFVVMSGEAWYDICLDAMNIQEWAWLLFVFYFSLMNLMVMNMFGSILVEKVLQCAKNREHERERMNDSRALGTFARLFVDLDQDGDGVISREELLKGLENEYFREEFYDANVCLLKDSEFLVRFWDYDDSGSIEFDEFVNGIQQLRHSGSNQKLLLLHHDIQAYGEQVLSAIAQQGNGSTGSTGSTGGGAGPDQKAWKDLSAQIVKDIGRTIDQKLKEHRDDLRQDFLALHKVARVPHVQPGISHGSVFFDNRTWAGTSELAAKVYAGGSDSPCGRIDESSNESGHSRDLQAPQSAAKKKSKKGHARRGERSLPRKESNGASAAHDQEPSPKIVSGGSHVGSTPRDAVDEHQQHDPAAATPACGARAPVPTELGSPDAPCAAAGHEGMLARLEARGSRSITASDESPRRPTSFGRAITGIAQE